MVFSNTSLSSPHLTFLSLLPSEQRAEHVPYMVKKELYRMRQQNHRAELPGFGLPRLYDFKGSRFSEWQTEDGPGGLK